MEQSLGITVSQVKFSLVHSCLRGFGHFLLWPLDVATAQRREMFPTTCPTEEGRLALMFPGEDGAKRIFVCVLAYFNRKHLGREGWNTKY